MISFFLPYTYPIEFIPKRMRNTSVVHAQSNMEVVFDEVAAGDAPVAARIKVPEIKSMRGFQDRRFANPMLPDDHPRELRWHDDRHWIEWGPVTDLVARMEAGSDGKETPFEGTQSFQFVSNDVNGRAQYRTEEWVRQNHYELRSLNNKDDSVREKITKLAKQVKVIDGIAFEAVSEPNLVIAETYGNDAPVITVEGFLPERYHRNDHVTIPRHLRRDRLTELPRMIEALSVAGIEHQVGCSVEILMPETFFRSPLRKEALDAAHAVEYSMMGAVKRMHRAGMAATLRLRDAIRQSPGRVSGAMVEALEDIVTMEDPRPEWLLMHAGIAERETAYQKQNHHHHGTTESQYATKDLAGAMASARRNATEALAAIRAETPGMLNDTDYLHLPVEGDIRELTASEDVAVAARACGIPPSELVGRWESGERLLCRGELSTSYRGWPTGAVHVGVIDPTTEHGLREIIAKDPDMFENANAGTAFALHLERHGGSPATMQVAGMQP